MANYDRILIVGDLNINLCCITKPLDFIDVLDAFNFEQFISGATHLLLLHKHMVPHSTSF